MTFIKSGVGMKRALGCELSACRAPSSIMLEQTWFPTARLLCNYELKQTKMWECLTRTFYLWFPCLELSLLAWNFFFLSWNLLGPCESIYIGIRHTNDVPRGGQSSRVFCLPKIWHSRLNVCFSILTLFTCYIAQFHLLNLYLFKNTIGNN